MKGLIPYVLSGVEIAGVAIAQTTPTPQSAPDIAPQTNSNDSGTTRLTITVAVANLKDLKIEQGDHRPNSHLLFQLKEQMGIGQIAINTRLSLTQPKLGANSFSNRQYVDSPKRT